MNGLYSKSYSLRPAEFAILARVSGLVQLYGMKMPVPEDEVQVINRTMFDLVRKGFVTVAGEKYRIAPEIRRIFDVIKEAGQVVLMHPDVDSLPRRVVYMGRNALLMEAGGVMGSFMKIRRIDSADMTEIIVLSGFVAELPMGESILLEKRETTAGAVLESIELEKLLLGERLHYTRGEQTEQADYAADNLRTMVEKMLDGQLN